MRDQKRRRMFAAVLAVLLAAMMIISLAVVMVQADELQAVPVSSSEEAVTSSSGLEAVSGTSLVKGQSGQAGTDAGTVDSSRKVYIENIDVTDMTEDEADAAVKKKMEELSADTIVFHGGCHTYETTAGELGLAYANTNIVKEALSIGTKGSALKRFLANRSMAENGPITLCLDLTVDAGKVKETVKNSESVLNCEPKKAGLKKNSDNTFSITEKEDGCKINEDAAAATIVSYMDNEWHGGEGGVVLDADITQAEDSTDQLKEVTDVLGTGTTQYSRDEANRDTNITLAVEKINGTVVYPGEEFSANKTIGPQTAETGFKLGGTYADGGVIQTYGGGVCQVTTTLYQAVLQAELEVTERHNHSFLVSYVTPGLDAAIAEDYMDLKFVNSTDYPIYIEGSVDESGNIVFNIYGHEYRESGRKVVYDSHILEYKDYDVAYKADPNADFGSLAVTGGQEGLDSELYKLVYNGDELVSNDLYSTSTYDPMDTTYTAGTKNATSATITAINQAIADKSLTELQSAIANGSTVDSDTQQ
ncbi:MAG: VanW family protein [Lachnospiraceae bacterium]|nr:VanW family protein [Lachnospiraceae bacterium]